jgi:N-acylneuraminate cytidylyltransferase
MKAVAIIPARGGSKRIPRKNIKDFCGQPIIAYSIQTAQNSGLFDRIIISTDDEEIAEVSRQYCAEIPFMRPKELADDYTGTTDVIAHATKWLRENKYQVEAVCCIYPTAPFISADDLSQGLSTLKPGNWDYVFSVTDYASTIFRSFKELPSGGIEMFFPDMFPKRSQDLPEALHDAGQFYWGLPEAWVSGKRLFDQKSCTLRIPRWRVQDIDTIDDWHRAEMIYNCLFSKKVNK